MQLFPSTRALVRLGGVLLCLLTACSSAEVQTGRDPHANFANYKTYAWAPQAAPEPGKAQSSILDQTIKSSVEKQLAAKGLTPAEIASPDLVIYYSAVARNEITYGAVTGPHHFWGPRYDETYVTRRGSLTLQFVDPKNNRTVWEGTATDTIGDAGASQEQVANAVKGLIQKYPTG